MKTLFLVIFSIFSITSANLSAHAVSFDDMTIEELEAALEAKKSGLPAVTIAKTKNDKSVESYKLAKAYKFASEEWNSTARTCFGLSAVSLVVLGITVPPVGLLVSMGLFGYSVYAYSESWNYYFKSSSVSSNIR